MNDTGPIEPAIGWAAHCDNLMSLISELQLKNGNLRIAISGALEFLNGEPEYHDQGMGCGLEDRGITDRYDAMSYGWDRAIERVYSENVAGAKDELSQALEAAE